MTGLFSTTHEVPSARCPFCDLLIDAASNADPEQSNPPKPGEAVTVCIGCSSILVYSEDFQLRAPTREEWRSIKASTMWPQLERVARAVRSIDRNKMTNKRTP